MRVLHVLGTGSYSGAENVAITIISGLMDEFTMGYCSPDGEIRHILEREGISFLPLAKRSAGHLYKAVQQFRPDIIHAHDYWAGTAASLLPLKFRLICHLHSNSLYAKGLNLRTLCFLVPLLRSSTVLGVSREVFEEHAFRGMLQKKGYVLPNAVDIARINRLAQENKGVSSHDIVFLGRFREEKDPLFFIELVARLSDRIPGFSACMIGDGPLMSLCRDRIRELQMEEKITLYGFLENPYPLLQNAKMLCMPSRWEGFGMAAMEAMCLGVPVLARPVGGLERLISESGGGFLCSTIEEFAERAEQLIRYSESRNYRGRYGSKWVRRNLSFSTFLNEIRAIYSKYPSETKDTSEEAV